MKKIGIITICKCGNYGAELQAVALLHKLLEMGFCAEIIDYVYYKRWNFHDTSLSRPISPMSVKEIVLYWIKYRIINTFVSCVLPFLVKSVRVREKRYNEFQRNYLKCSRTFFSMNSLYINPPVYDVYMTGSDQVWNPGSQTNLEPYFLTFSPKNARRVSYASSFGVSKIDTIYRDKFKAWLSDYNYIAVREREGQQLIKEMTEKEAAFVLDPTLLLNAEEWMAFAQDYPNLPERYAVIYSLGNSNAIDNLALRYGMENSVPIFRICKRAYGVPQTNGIINIKDAGPAEFLSIISNSVFVFTDSYHGTAFSVNFDIPFIVMLSKTKNNNSRVISLLETLGLEEQIYWDDDNCDGVGYELDAEKVHRRLCDFRKSSISYLKHITM